MKNPRITAKDLNVIKGGMRRAFARSELHDEVLKASIIEHSDPSRPRVKTWCKCAKCGLPEAKSYMDVDHIEPLVPINSSMKELPLEQVIDRLWCPKGNLQVLCPVCHDMKTKVENEARRKFKKMSRVQPA